MIATDENDDRHERHNESARLWAQRQAAKGHEIGELPPIADRERREACRLDFRLACEVYFPRAFPLPWSPDHETVIAAIEAVVLEGGLGAIAMPRGSGKTTLCERAIIWAILYGHRHYGMLIAADEGKAEKRLRTIKTELETNPLLLGDFPEVCYPIFKLDRQVVKAKGQTYRGEPTRIVWGANEIVLPTVASSAASGSLIGVGGITGAVRGPVYLKADGSQMRPDVCLLDDPQTRESAKSIEQSKTREDIITADVLGMAGPGESIAALATVTVIYENDAADKLLSRSLHPDWRGIRTRMLGSFPADMELWGQYDTIRRACLESGNSIEAATEFYVENQAAMDLGATVCWPDRKKPDEASGLQHAMNLYFKSPKGFASEYQNEPMPIVEVGADQLKPEQICAKTNGIARSRVPHSLSELTCMVDVQKTKLYWCVCAWGDGFGGSVVDYGSWPHEKSDYFTLASARHTLQRKYPARGLEAQIYAGLTDLAEFLLAREWTRDGDGAQLRIKRLLIDANWGESTDLIYDFCRASKHATQLMACHGRGVTASSTPFAEYKRKKGERVGHNWRIPSVSGKRAVRHVLFDANYWKSFLHARLATATGDPGSLSLFHPRDGRASLHAMFADQLSAEYGVPVSAKGRTVVEWKIRPDRPDNHFLDCLVGNFVAASMEGIRLPEGTGTAQARRPQRRGPKEATYL